MADRGPEEMGTPIQILAAQTVYTPDEISGAACVVIEGTRIRDVWPATTAVEARERIARLLPDMSVAVSDLGVARLAPGFIDLHIHGSHGYDVNSGSAPDIREMARRLPAGGTTAFYPTIATTNRRHTLDCVSSIVEAAQRASDEPMAEIAGIRLEGPFISSAKKGAQYGADIRRPDPVELRELVDAGQGLVRFVDFAPEEDGAEQLLASAVRLGLVPCVGHTNATFEQTIQALDGGTRHSTHLFNAMSPLKHQAPGVPGALLTDERATVEIIADGVHLAPATLRLVLRARSPRDVALVTDAMPATGLPDGEYDFLHRKVIVRGRAARLANGALAGSTLTLDLAVLNMVEYTGIGWASAIEMATATPARIAGIDLRRGRLAPGYDADIVALDVDGRVLRTWTRGTLAYSAEPALERMS
ncbi:MAG TPA: N-acetylglucosamine-6-phosphate deacetylase [Ktedonobacterales bacterium]|nr:N-acetylglucosamine-6-phosphate deacetylase [Ktedonobacterales bacterium]